MYTGPEGGGVEVWAETGNAENDNKMQGEMRHTSMHLGTQPDPQLDHSTDWMISRMNFGAREGSISRTGEAPDSIHKPENQNQIQISRPGPWGQTKQWMAVSRRLPRARRATGLHPWRD